MDTGYPDIDHGFTHRCNGGGVGGVCGCPPKPWVSGPCTPYTPPEEPTEELKKLLEEIQKDESICAEAERIVNGERDQAYGDIVANFSRIAKLWSVVLKVEVNVKQVALCMVMLKISRQLNKEKRDNLVDACGYLLCLQKIIDQEAKL